MSIEAASENLQFMFTKREECRLGFDTSTDVEL